MPIHVVLVAHEVLINDRNDFYLGQS